MKSKKGAFQVTLILWILTLWLFQENPVTGRKQAAPYAPEPASEKIFSTFPSRNEPIEGIVLSIMEDRRGDFWFGALNGQLHRFRKDGRKETIPVSGAAGTGMGALAQDLDGNVWIGTFGKGVFKLRITGPGISVIERLTTGQGLADNTVHSIFFDKKGNAWFGTQDGVSRYDGAVMATLKMNRGLAGNEVRNVYEDGNNDIWIATDKGITVLEKGHFDRQRQKNYLEGESVTGIHIDPGCNGKEQYWITTYGSGLKLIRNEKVVSFTWENGLPTNILYQIREDRRKKLWITSAGGVLRLSKSKLEDVAEGQNKWIVSTVFGISHGMESVDFYNGFSRHSVLKTSAGRLMFATKKAVYMLEPEKVKINDVPPSVVIEKMTLMGPEGTKTVIRPPRIQNSKGWPEIEKNIAVQFTFTARTNESQETITYKYKLEDRDDEWRYLRPGARRIAEYRNLEPRIYTFRVTAANSDGVWNNVGASYTFIRKKTLPESVLFKIFLVIFALSVTAACYYGFRRKKKHKTPRNGVGENGKSAKLQPAYIDVILKKLKQQMEQEKCYREENLSLQDLAEKLSIPSHHLSQVINEKLNKNFSDFVNTYRIEEAMEHLADSGQKSRKILSIAFEVGFNTKATFNYVFKKHTGMTPSQYRKKY